MSSAATTFWRRAGMTYLQMCSESTTTLRSCLKEPMRTTALANNAIQYTRKIEGSPSVNVNSIAASMAK
eukprot:CAMPEP_0172610088 /NCGR_PEP_ID=MMETSP1068-20121228/29955_1 /TAXON_ID=35684 /ORGANISM="Pseudopedinella elastica, Strain CCMP716" /LENGTH=68 /DNA_ID=CAMNT_0013413723 /DNA_START=55 /DNA_END=261 /DNA_ORIENTATION=+